MTLGKKRSRMFIAVAAVAAMLAVPSLSTAAGDKYPQKPITIIVPFPAGGGTDLAIRGIQQALQEQLAVPVIIENKPGAGGTIGTAAAAKAAADGYTLVAVTTTTIASAKAVYPRLSYDPRKDFVSIGSIGTSPFVLVVSSQLPVTSFAEFVSYAKTQGNKLNYASVGNGSASHLVGELFKRQTGVQMTHVPYRGAAPAQTDLMAGHVQALFDNPTALVEFVKGGKIKALATSATTESLPGVTTFESNGLGNFKPELWYGIMGPAALPPAVVARLHNALDKAIQSKAVAGALTSRGITPASWSPEAFAQRIASDTALWGDIAKSVDARAE